MSPADQILSRRCGLHVHVAAPQDPRVLSMLAGILLVYEEEIARLHPLCRRPVHKNARHLIESNRSGFLYKFNEQYTSISSGEQDILFGNEKRQRDCSILAMKRGVVLEYVQSELKIATALTSDSDEQKRKRLQQ